MPTGTVKKFFADKGFGFIQPDDGTGDVFAPVRTFAGDKLSVFEGLRVNFEGGADEKTGKPMASSWFAEGGQAMPPAGYAMPGMQPQPIGSMGPGTGHLKRFYADKGYGFIARGDGTGDLFAPSRTFTGQEHEIQEGMQVSYEAGPDDRSGKPRATAWGPLGSISAFGMMGGMPGLGMDRFNPYGGFGGAASLPAALPAGWESAVDPASGKTYYFNRGTGQTSWEPPAAAPQVAAPPPAAAALPAGWESAADPASGKTYYFNRATGATQWDAPLQ